MADKTALAESAQALFCAIGDYLGNVESNNVLNIKTFVDYNSFASANRKTIDLAFKRIETPGVTLDNLEDFLSKDISWYKSSVLIASKLVKDIINIDPNFNKISRKGFQDIYYFRGDRLVMGKIEELFKLAQNNGIGKLKNQPALSDINKWSPADIYYSSLTANKEIDKRLTEAKKNPKAFTFAQLNILVSELIDTGDLLPLSLKKTTSTVKLQKVNFDRKQELKEIKNIKVKGTTDWKPYKRVKYGQTTQTRDMRILVEGGEIKMRHDPSSKRFVVEYIIKGAEARGGSIGSIKVFTDILSLVDKPLADKILKLYNEGDIAFKNEQKELDKLKSKMDKAQFDFERGANSAINIINRIMPPLKEYFTKNAEGKGDLIAQLLYEYTTSRTSLSGKFVIAK
jgi:hypothetical protein